MTFIAAALTDDSFVPTKFPKTQSTSNGKVNKFIYKTLTGATYDANLCSALCFMDSFSTPACHFWLIEANKCYLANPFESNSFSASGGQNVYFNESKFSSFLFNFFEFSMLG
jgi:hypothetical protein